MRWPWRRARYVVFPNLPPIPTREETVIPEIFDPTPAPSGKFGVWPRNDGGIHLAFYRPDGCVAATVDLDMAAAADFWVAINETVRKPDA